MIVIHQRLPAEKCQLQCAKYSVALGGGLPLTSASVWCYVG